MYRIKICIKKLILLCYWQNMKQKKKLFNLIIFQQKEMNLMKIIYILISFIIWIGKGIIRKVLNEKEPFSVNNNTTN